MRNEITVPILPENRVFEYPYSSMSMYIRKQKDTRKLIDTDFILGYVNENDKAKARIEYAAVVTEKRDLGINTKLRKYLEEFEKFKELWDKYQSDACYCEGNEP